MEPKKRLGKGLEDISHLFLSSAKPSESKSPSSENRNVIELRGHLTRVIAVISRTPEIPTIFWTTYLALALAQCGQKALVIDIGTDRDELASVLKPLAIHPSLGDLLNEPEKVIVVESPQGLRVLAFQMQLEELRQFKEEEREILLQILRREEQQADVLLVNTPLDLMKAEVRAYLKCLNEAVMVASPHDLLGAYRLLKVLFHLRPSLRVGLVEYGGPEDIARGGLQRLVMASREFLKQSPSVLGEIPPVKTPLLFSDQEGSSIQNLLELGKRILQGLNGRESRGLFFDEIQNQLNTGC